MLITKNFELNIPHGGSTDHVYKSTFVVKKITRVNMRNDPSDKQ